MNKPADTAFIEAHEGEFSFTPQGQLVWQGRREEYGIEYQAAPDEYRCRSSRPVKDGDGQEVLDQLYRPILHRCHKWAMRGAAVCVECANGSEAVKRAVKAMLVSAAPALAARLIHIAVTTPEEKDAIKAILAVLDRVGIRGGVEVAPDVPLWQEALTELMGEGNRGTIAGTEGS